jgi:hypothetical protein
MFIACYQGQLDVVKWLFEAGAVKNIRTKNDDDQTPMFAACSQGHLDVVKWLFEAGAVKNIRTKSSIGGRSIGGPPVTAPMWIACVSGHMDVVQWLILKGAANNDDGHVDRAILQRDLVIQARPGLHSYFEVLVNEHSTFTSLVLPATRFPAVEPPLPGTAAKKHRPGPTAGACVLALLRGHEEGVLSLIADFAGVVRGRPLRNAREFSAALNEDGSLVV